MNSPTTFRNCEEMLRGVMRLPDSAWQKFSDEEAAAYKRLREALKQRVDIEILDIIAMRRLCRKHKIDAEIPA